MSLNKHGQKKLVFSWDITFLALPDKSSLSTSTSIRSQILCKARELKSVSICIGSASSALKTVENRPCSWLVSSSESKFGEVLHVFNSFSQVLCRSASFCSFTSDSAALKWSTLLIVSVFALFLSASSGIKKTVSSSFYSFQKRNLQFKEHLPASTIFQILHKCFSSLLWLF